MANLLEIAELCFKQLYPNPGDETTIRKEEFIASARSEYAYQMWLRILAERREEGMLEVPSYLLTEKELEVKNNEIDISSLKIMRALPWEVWLQDVGGATCSCKYVKTTINLYKTLFDDDSLADDDKLFYVVGKKIKFPRGAHASSLPITYANNGENVNDRIDVDDAVAGLVRRSLLELYAGKIGKEDKRNDSKAEQ